MIGHRVSEIRAPSPWVAHLGTTGLFGFALFAFLGIAGANIGIALMLVALALDRRSFWPALRGDPSLLLFLWTLTAVAVSAGLGAWLRPQETPEQWDGLLKVLQLFLFLAVAWWLRGSERRILWMLALALIGFWLGVYRALDATSLASLLALQRPHFIWSINAFGQYSAACLLGMALLTPRFWRWPTHTPWRWPARCGWLALMGLAGAGVVLSWSRGVWLSTVVVAAALILYLGWTRRRAGVGGRGPVFATLIGVALAIGSLCLNDAIRIRIAEIARPLVELWVVQGHAEQLSDHSDRTRAQLLELGLQSWRASPWFGSGPAAPKLIIRDQRERFPDWRNYSDFHNLAVDMLASFGIVGALPLLSTFVLVLWVAHRGYRAGRLDRDIYLTIVSLLVLSALAQMTDTRILSSHGRFYSMLLAGAAYSWWLVGRSVPARGENPSADR